MKKISSTTITMMEMCMPTCCMCMTFCTDISDRFSICDAKHIAT